MHRNWVWNPLGTYNLIWPWKDAFISIKSSECFFSFWNFRYKIWHWEEEAKLSSGESIRKHTVRSRCRLSIAIAAFRLLCLQSHRGANIRTLLFTHTFHKREAKRQTNVHNTWQRQAFCACSQGLFQKMVKKRNLPFGLWFVFKDIVSASGKRFEDNEDLLDRLSGEEVRPWSSILHCPSPPHPLPHRSGISPDSAHARNKHMLFFVSFSLYFYLSYIERRKKGIFS